MAQNKRRTRQKRSRRYSVSRPWKRVCCCTSLLRRRLSVGALLHFVFSKTFRRRRIYSGPRTAPIYPPPSARMFAQSRVASPSPEAIQSKAITFRQRITRLKTTLVLFVSLIRLVGPEVYLTFERIVVGLPGHPSGSSKFIAAVKTQAKVPQHLGRTVHFQCPH